MASTERIRDRIKKILRLRKSPNEHEAARATELAERLMAKHGIVLDDVEEEERFCDDDEADAMAAWRRDLALVIARSRGVTALSRTRSIGFRGAPAAVRSAAESYSELRHLARIYSVMSGGGEAVARFFRSVFWQTLVEIAQECLTAPRAPAASPPEAAPPPPSDDPGVPLIASVEQAVGKDTSMQIHRAARTAAARAFVESGVGPWRPETKALR